MARDGSGNYNLPGGNPVVTNTIISSSGWANPTLSDIAAALTQSLSRDGQTTPTADLTMGNFKLRNLANAIARTDAINAGQIQDGGVTTLSSVAGTDTITASTSPAITAYAAGSVFTFTAAGANATNAVTLNLNGLGAQALTKYGANALNPGDIRSGMELQVLYDGTRFQWLNVFPFAASPSFRNKIINGNFDFWQRGTSFSGAFGYYADRWFTGIAGSSVVNSQQAFALGQTAVPNNPKYFARHVVTSVAGASNFIASAQYIEGVGTYSGSYVTLSFWAKADANRNIAAEIWQNFGSGGSPSGAVTGIGVQTCALTTAWQKFSLSVLLPSVSGKTVGTNNNDALAAQFWFDSGSNFNSRNNSLGQQSGTFDIAQVQLEAGTQALPFELRPPAEELALCQRYHYRITSQFGGLIATGQISTTSNLLITVPYNLRSIAPALSFSNLSALDTSVSQPVNGLALNGNNTAVAGITVATTGTSLTVGRCGTLFANSAGAFLALDAEL